MGQTPTRIELVQSDALEFSAINGKGTKRLKGHVILRQDAAIMHCDSAWLVDEENSFEGFGHVVITQGDSLEMTGETVSYMGNEKTAIIRHHVFLRQGNMTLQTEEVQYNMDQRLAFYPFPGKIVQGNTVLTSQSGQYAANSKLFSFRKKVLLVAPEYRMETDTMRFQTETEIAYFFGPTYIISASDTIYCENGWYDTRSERSQFSRNAWIHSGSQWIKADSLLYNRKTGIGRGFRNIWIHDTSEGFTITGQKAVYKNLQKEALVTGSPLSMRLSGTDTFWVWADTLFYSGDTLGKGRHLLGYPNARVYKYDLQAACDSLAYNLSDSMVSLFKNPVLWNEENQLSADSISFRVRGGQPEELELKTHAFIASREAEGRYNQIKGRFIRGFFLNGKLNQVRVYGDGQSIYYAKEDSAGYIGVNKAQCADMLIQLKEQKVARIVMYDKPSGTLFPIDGTNPAELILSEFRWQVDRRPAPPIVLAFPALSRPKR